MIDLHAFSRKIRRLKSFAAGMIFGGAAMVALDFTLKVPPVERGALAALAFVIFGVGGYLYYRSLELPATEVLHLAQSRNGLLTLGEIATALDISPDLAFRTLKYLQTSGLATPRWEEMKKNLWEFPDYLKLPIAEILDMAKAKGGRISLKDLVAAGISLDLAIETFDTLAAKGIARQEGAEHSPEGRSLVMEK